jgi:hypothetical protein
MLPNKIHDAPATIALLNAGDRERRDLGAPEAAAQERRQDRAVVQSLSSCDIRSIQ